MINVGYVRPMGPVPPLSAINVVELDDAQTALLLSSRNKPKMGIPLFTFLRKTPEESDGE